MVRHPTTAWKIAGEGEYCNAAASNRERDAEAAGVALLRELGEAGHRPVGGGHVR
jgi:hypothetical protein